MAMELMDELEDIVGKMRALGVVRLRSGDIEVELSAEEPRSLSELEALLQQQEESADEETKLEWGKAKLTMYDQVFPLGKPTLR